MYTCIYMTITSQIKLIKYIHVYNPAHFWHTVHNRLLLLTFTVPFIHLSHIYN